MPSLAALAEAPEATLHIRVGSQDLAFSAYWSEDSNSTTTGLPGPGRVLGHMFSVGGRRIEAVAARTAALAGFGFEGLTRRLLMRLRSPHMRCGLWPAFSSAPVVDLAVELGNGCCGGCQKRYAQLLDGEGLPEVEALLVRLIPSIESAEVGNRTQGAMILAVFALSHSRLRSALLKADIIRHVQLSLHSCKRLMVNKMVWGYALDAVGLLHHVLTTALPSWWFDLETWSLKPHDQHVTVWHEVTRYSARLEEFNPEILDRLSFVASTRLSSAITISHALAESLITQSGQVHVHTAYLESLRSAAINAGSGTSVFDHCEHILEVIATVALLGNSASPHVLGALLDIHEAQLSNDLRALAGAGILAHTRSKTLIILSLPLRVSHSSVYNFVEDPDPSRHNDVPKSRHRLAERCLALLVRHLKYDLCETRNPTLANSDIPDLAERLASNSSDAIWYASHFGLLYLAAEGSPSNSLQVALTSFCETHALHWLELHSLQNTLSSAEKQLYDAMIWCERYEHLPAIKTALTTLDNTRRVLLDYHVPIQTHALQVYHSVLATMPECPLLDANRAAPLLGRPHLLSSRASATVWPHTSEIRRARGAVRSVTYSPDAALIISGGSHGTILVWDAFCGRKRARLEGHRDWVYSVAISPNGTRIATGSQDRTARLWDVHNSVCVAVLTGHDRPVRCVVFSPDGNRLASGSLDGTVRLWDTHNGTAHGVIRSGEEISCVTFSPDGRVIAFASGPSVEIWDAHHLWQHKKLDDHQGDVELVSFSPDGTRIIYSSLEGSVFLWSIEDATLLTSCDLGLVASVSSLAFSSDGTQIILGCSDGALRLWSRDLEELAVFEGHTHDVTSVSFSPDGTRLVSSSLDCTIRVWDIHRTTKVVLLLNLEGGDHDADKMSHHSQMTTDAPAGFPHSAERHASRVTEDISALDIARVRSCQEGSINVPCPAALISDERSGWISWHSNVHAEIRLCWLPLALRGKDISCDENRIAVLAHDGGVTVLDFVEMLARLRSLTVL